MEYRLLKGNESFTDGGNPITDTEGNELTMDGFWKYHFSNIYDMQDEISEYVVAKALGINIPSNKEIWTLYDIAYPSLEAVNRGNGLKVEIKETSYYHSWQTDEEKKSESRRFSIKAAFSIYKDNSSEYKRQSDVYVFCLNTGSTREGSFPLEMKNWEFYVVETSVINECYSVDQKTIALSEIRKLVKKNYAVQCTYGDLKKEIDKIYSNRLT